MNIQEIENIIRESEMVLVGIGEELESGFSVLESSGIYTELVKKAEAEGLSPEEYEWMYPYLLREAEKDSSKAQKIRDFYCRLRELLGDKNYFMITMNMDSMPEQNGFLKERLVKPFGNYEKMQCDRGCTNRLWSAQDFEAQIVRCVRSGEGKLSSLKKGSCPHCGGEAVLNNVNAEKYIEDGYLESWKRYTKWIEGTMNRKVCILELGVMLNYPSMIRWPFEKMGYLNKKASFIRINSRIPQLTEELKEKGISVRANPISFFLDR